ncbi:34365_t:CDS:2 [Gigaspora margarita]|uniref:Calcium-transporting ATPase n=1 Tax=Gigaspora margarita TaxID=4874 RepID=A0ABN7UQG6_GIGMA|nr:34365_t:CDS:2 [Gigaspora margarita]
MSTDHEEGFDKTPTNNIPNNIPIIVIENSKGEAGGSTDTPEISSLSLLANKSDLTLCSSVSTKVESEEMNSDKEKSSHKNDHISIDTGPFAYTSAHLWKMMSQRNFELLRSIGGLDGIIEGLRTHRTNGLNTTEESEPLIPKENFENIPDNYQDILKNYTDTESIHDFSKHPDNNFFSDRIRTFGKNVLPEAKSKSILEFMWLAMQEKVLILLTIAAFISLGLGLYEDFSENAPLKVRWIEGVAIIFAILIVVLVGSVNDWQKEKQFRSLNAKKEDREVKVIRDSKPSLISIHDVLVGDVLQLEPGEVVAADGILISGYNIYCDQSDETGESDSVKKFTYDDCVKRFSDSDSRSSKLDPFVISGSRVLEGVGTYVVTGIGVNSCRGKTWMSLRTQNEDTPLQIKLNDLAEQIAKLGGAAALLMLIVLLIKYFISFRVKGIPSAADAINNLVTIIISAVTVVVVAVPEGLPLAVTLASCETMGNATTVCSDKTGTLTQNLMTVVVATIGLSDSFARNVDNNNNIEGSKNLSDIKNLPEPILEILYKSIAINTTAFEGEPKNGKPNFVGSKTETALLQLLLDLDVDYKQLKEDAKVTQIYPFGSERKAMGLVIQEDSRFRFYVKGASEILLRKSRYIVDINSYNKTELSDQEKDTIQQTIKYYASKSLRTLALGYRDLDQWPPSGLISDPDGEIKFEDLMVDITFLCIVGIEDPLREGVHQAVKDCKDAGVKVRMVTGDNILTAQSIAKQCGILTSKGLVMEGPEFRNLSLDEMKKILPNLEVLARSSPEDKKILVETLKQELNDIVAVTGDGTNDGPALRTADVGFSMGISGTEAAKEASSIILMDDNFSSIVKAIMWGRCVNDAVKKFLQFQLTVNVTAVALTFISAVSSDQQKSVLTAVQLLWVNLIMDTFAALALATDPPTPILLKRKPENRDAPLITPQMWKMIIGQSIFQLAITLILLYAADDIVGFGFNDDTLNTIVFNAFVMLQIFNEINCRNLDEKLNVFKNIFANKFFIIIFVITSIGQFLIVQFGGYAFKTAPLTFVQWIACIGLGALSIPVGIIIRLLPIEKLFTIAPIRVPTIADDESAITRWQKQLKVFKALRGGGRFRSHFGGDEQNHQAFASVAVVPSLMIVSSVGVTAATRNTNKDKDDKDDSRALERSIPTKLLTQQEPNGSSKNSVASQDDKIEVQNHS